jgi:hypothetical protein
MKKNIAVAKEFYETFERLQHEPDFVKFREDIVEKEIDNLAERILNADLTTNEQQANVLSDIRLYQRTIKQYQTFFSLAEGQSKLIRKQVKQREKKRKEQMA